MLRTLTLQQLDRALANLADAPLRPKAGWLRAIRNGLGMTTRQLAAKVGVSQAAVMDAESAETRNDITLATLQRYADALSCDVVYVLRPRHPLEQIVDAQADRIARLEVARVRHSMALEAQATDDASIETQVEELRRRLLEGKPSRLWK
jgi:predicted DNA-binding mobile mystery protein A